jgi:looped-hinge helix DNA binding domain, AbrB family
MSELGRSKITSKNQITIPREVRDTLNIREGSWLSFDKDFNDRVYVTRDKSEIRCELCFDVDLKNIIYEKNTGKKIKCPLCNNTSNILVVSTSALVCKAIETAQNLNVKCEISTDGIFYYAEFLYKDMSEYNDGIGIMKDILEKGHDILQLEIIKSALRKLKIRDIVSKSLREKVVNSFYTSIGREHIRLLYDRITCRVPEEYWHE